MNIIEKINRTRYTLKEILSEAKIYNDKYPEGIQEWNTDGIADLSDEEIERMYNVPASSDAELELGKAVGCNFSIEHKLISGYYLHVIYYGFNEIDKPSKVTKSFQKKIYNLYENEIFNKHDSVLIIVNDEISESIKKILLEININNVKLIDEIPLGYKANMKEFDYDLEAKHFRNYHMFYINELINNLLNHELVPKHIVYRCNKEKNKILENCNCKLNQLPIIKFDDAISKLIRLAPDDICEIIRTSKKCGEYPFYRVCKY
jgi:DNA-directed RNA polymerase subunit H (RpoH/RPB5)